MTDYPITPPPELVQQWIPEIWHEGTPVQVAQSDLHVANRAAQWGADQELEACCKWLPKLPPWSGEDLRKHRRPKPPSLKEQAMQEFDHLMSELVGTERYKDRISIIRRALEALADD